MKDGQRGDLSVWQRGGQRGEVNEFIFGSWPKTSLSEV